MEQDREGEIRGTFKLTTIECAVCAGLIDVFQEVDPEVTVWRGRDEEENACQRPPVPSCPRHARRCCGCIRSGPGGGNSLRSPQSLSGVAAAVLSSAAWATRS